MQIGLYLNNAGGFPSADGGVRGCLHLAQQAERLGFGAVWVSDVPDPGSLGVPASSGQDTGGAYEPLTLLSALAQVTSRVEIGVATLTVPLRHPLMTAKMLSTADRLSGGRVIFSAGTGKDERDFAAAGVSGLFPEREAVTDDYLRAIKEAWLNTGPSRYTGEYVRFAEVGAFPHPVRQPHIPIWIGGSDPGWLRRAVRLGSGFISAAPDVETFAQHRAEARRLAEQDRRDPDEITGALVADVTISAGAAGSDRALLTGSVEQITDDLRRLEAAGVQHLIAAVKREAGGSLEARMDAVQTLTAVLPLYRR